jgi:hypothetical protein
MAARRLKDVEKNRLPVIYRMEIGPDDDEATYMCETNDFTTHDLPKLQTMHNHGPYIFNKYDDDRISYMGVFGDIQECRLFIIKLNEINNEWRLIVVVRDDNKCKLVTPTMEELRSKRTIPYTLREPTNQSLDVAERCELVQQNAEMIRLTLAHMRGGIFTFFSGIVTLKSMIRYVYYETGIKPTYKTRLYTKDRRVEPTQPGVPFAFTELKRNLKLNNTEMAKHNIYPYNNQKLSLELAGLSMDKLPTETLAPPVRPPSRLPDVRSATPAPAFVPAPAQKLLDVRSATPAPAPAHKSPAVRSATPAPAFVPARELLAVRSATPTPTPALVQGLYKKYFINHYKKKRQLYEYKIYEILNT